MRMVHALTLAALALPALLSAQQQGVEQAVRTITEEDYLRRVGILAHDSMMGRDTPSEGLDETAAWIASEFRRMGLRPGAEARSFLQGYPLRSMVVDLERSSLRAGSAGLSYGRDLFPLFGGGVSGEATGGLVLVSGARDVGPGLADGAVRGQHAVLVLEQGVEGLDQRALQLAMTVRNAGAVSVLVTNSMDQAMWEGNAARALEPELSRGWVERNDGGAFRPLLLVRDTSIEGLLRGRGVDFGALQARADEDLRVDLVPNLTATLTQRSVEETITAPNVVGILPGSDPDLRDEYVLFSAHMDHVGVGAPDERGDSIFNGADDDASGTAAVIEIAEAMAALPTAPKRSMIFLLVSGEEKGLWGSEYFSQNPSVPIDRIVAGLNMDMVARNWPDTIVAIGREHSDLGETLERVNAEHPELGMTAIDDLWPEENFYGRSDHYNFARLGVPILFFFNGTHEDYHGRDDEVEKIDAEKAARIAQLVFYLGLEVANAEERPAWNPDSYARIVTDRSP